MTTRPRIKVPDSVRNGEVIEVRTVLTHVMETGLRKGADGQVVPRDIINTMTATYAGKEVFKASLQAGTAANPAVNFHMRVAGPGDLELTWTDDAGKKIVEKVKLNVVG
ncbi:MAG TPA: thiosulfate oxidation carrier complex protein SoxZ [Hyphomicrobiaceae bacterium]|nr:thiosulfate oxidation carrier complex protein SoxZ [Hyphomicrobiaceae bacterium]